MIQASIDENPYLITIAALAVALTIAVALLVKQKTGITKEN